MKITCNVNIKENIFKIYMMWYLTPARLAKMYGGNSGCWRCSHNHSGFQHMWWDCPQIKKFWLQIQNQIYYITNIKLSFCLQIFLLNILYVGQNKKHNLLYRLIILLLTAAHLVNALCLKKSITPILAEWHAKVWNNANA